MFEKHILDEKVGIQPDLFEELSTITKFEDIVNLEEKVQY